MGWSEMKSLISDFRVFLDDKKTVRAKRRELFKWARTIATNTDALECVYDEIVAKGVLQGPAARKNMPEFREKVEMAFLKQLAEKVGVTLPFKDSELIKFAKGEYEPVVGWRDITDNRLFVRKGEL